MQHKHHHITLLWAFMLLFSNSLYAQVSRLTDTLLLRSELKGMTGNGKHAPLWLSNNQYGLASIDNRALVWSLAVGRDIKNDTERNWRVGYGAKLGAIVDTERNWVVQELYADVQYKALRLSLGQKERPAEMLNPLLSSGGLVMSNNARPLPQVRLEVPDFWAVPGTNGWLSLRGHVAYGAYTDNKWQRDFVGSNSGAYSANSLYHSKAGFVRLGNAIKFPVTIDGGLEMHTQFSGTAYNIHLRDDDKTGAKSGSITMPRNFKAFWDALIPGGSDPTDGIYSNRQGNTVGAWHLAINIHGMDWDADELWKARLYAQHVFEDESQLFWQYGWRDIMVGTEINLPQNPIVSDIVYEYLTTRDQSGPIYHDKTPQIPDQISALDNYYNHGIYGAWQHAGFGLGNALLLSPIYNSKGQLTFVHNRINAHHASIKGNPTKEIDYRLMFSHIKSWGTYSSPLTDPQSGWTMLASIGYQPKWLSNCRVGFTYGHNGGKLLGNSNGYQLSFGWNHKIYNKKQRTTK